MKQLILGAAVAALAGCAGLPASAGALVDVAVVDRTTGERLAVHHHRGRHYVAGAPGRKYAVYVANRTGERVLAVMSVDGINVVSGETAATDQAGYVLAPGQSYEVAGWRKSMSEIAAFYFTALPDSYAARTDRPGNVGVIGVAVFREWQPPRPAAVPLPEPYARRDRPAESRAQGESEGARDEAAEAPSAPAAAGAAGRSAAPSRPADIRRQREEKLGTGHGEREWSAVRHTDFRRASSTPAETITLYYDSHRNLVARGIIRRAPPPGADPQPFPGGRFVPDPWG